MASRTRRDGPQTAPAAIILTPAQYLNTIVLPTVAEFLEDPTDPRRAYLACMVTAHLVDQITRSEKLPKNDVRAAIARSHEFGKKALEIVEGISNGTKHAGTGRGEPFPFAPGYEGYDPGFKLGAPGSAFEQGGWGHPPGLIVKHGSFDYYIDDSLRIVVAAFRTAYPRQLAVKAL
jgi:hypothetical protein